MSLLAWYPLIKDMHNQGVGDADVTITTSPTFGAGKIGGALISGGTCTWTAAQTNKILNNTALSFAFWIYPNVATGTAATSELFGNNPMSANNNRKFSIWQYPTCNDLHYSWQNDEANTTFATAVLTGYLPSYTWTHVVFSYENPVLKIYINGNLVRTDTNAVSNSSTFAYDTTVIRNDSSRWVCDFRVYNHALSIKEAKELSKGLVLHFPLHRWNSGNDNIVPGTFANEVQYTYPSSSYSDRWSATTSIVPSENQYTLSFYAKSTVAGDKVRAHWYSPNTTTRCETNQGTVTTAGDGNIDFTLSTKWEKYWCIYTQSETTAVKHLIFPRMFSQASGGATGTGIVSVRCVKLEAGNKATPWRPNSSDSGYSTLADTTLINDVAGYGYNATINGSMPTYSSDAPKYSISPYFSGRVLLLNQMCPDYLPIYGLTANIWIKPTTWFNPFSCTESGGWNFEQNGNGYLQFPVYIAGIGYGAAASTVTGASLQDGKWHMLTGTFDPNGGKIRFYIDGVLKGSYDAGTTANIGYQTNKLVIGGEASGTGSSSSYYTSYVGNISDARIYATPLSEVDIKELYQVGISLANNGNLFAYEFNE